MPHPHLHSDFYDDTALQRARLARRVLGISALRVRLWALIDAADAAVDAEAPGGALNALVRSAPPALARSGPRDGADLCLYRPFLASHDSSCIDLSFPCIDLSIPCLCTPFLASFPFFSASEAA